MVASLLSEREEQLTVGHYAARAGVAAVSHRPLAQAALFMTSVAA